MFSLQRKYTNAKYLENLHTYTLPTEYRCRCSISRLLSQILSNVAVVVVVVVFVIIAVVGVIKLDVMFQAVMSQIFIFRSNGPDSLS